MFELNLEAFNLLHRFHHWTDKYAGLAGWVGAIGAIIAILFTWWLARAEYLRTRRQDIARLRGEIDLITRIISEFEMKMTQFIELQRTDDLEAANYYTKHLNDPEFHSMRDLAHLPVSNWHSLEAYGEFKRYWYACIKLGESAGINNVDRQAIFDDWKRRHDESLPKLMTALGMAR